jgi:4-amino-4-deoxy-L-arabinose transferase-like glycosyltransferase
LSNEWVLLSLITFFGAILRIITPTTLWGYLSPDEARYLKLALEILLESSISDSSFKPGLPLLILAVMLAIGYHELAGYLIAQTLGILIVPLSYSLGKELRSQRAGLLSAILFAASAPFIHHSTRILTDVPSLFFSILAILLFTKSYNSEKEFHRILFSIIGGFSLLVAVVIRPSSISLVGALFFLGVYHVIKRKDERKHLVRVFTYAALTITIPIISIILVSTYIGLAFASAITSFIVEFVTNLNAISILWNILLVLSRAAASLVLLAGIYTGEKVFFFLVLIVNSIAVLKAVSRRTRADLVLLSWMTVYFVLYILDRNLVSWDDWRYLLPLLAPSLFLVAFVLDESLPDIKAGFESVSATWISLMTTIEMKIDKIDSKTFSIALALLTVSAIYLSNFWIYSAILITSIITVVGIRMNERVSLTSITIVAVLLIVSSTNMLYVMCANYVARENTIEDWEVYSPSIQSMKAPPEEYAGFRVWISRFSLPRIQRPSETNLSEGGVFTWVQNIDVLILAWNNTDQHISGWLRIRGFDVRILEFPEVFFTMSLQNTGYFHELRFNLTPTESLQEIHLQLVPKITSDDFRIEYDLFETDIDYIWVGQNHELLAYTLSVDWLHFNIVWANNENPPYQIEVVSEDLGLGEIEYPIWSDWNHLVESYAITGKKISFVTNHSTGEFSVSYKFASGPEPLIRLNIDSNFTIPIYAEDTSYQEGTYEVRIIQNDEHFPTSLITLLSVTPLLSIVTIISASIITFLIWKFVSIDLVTRSTITSFLLSSIVFSVFTFSTHFNESILLVFNGLTSYYYAVLSLRVSYISSGLVTTLISLRSGQAKKQLNEVDQLNMNEDTDTEKQNDSSLSLAFNRRKLGNLFYAFLVISLIFTGPLAALDLAMETRETYDSIMKCGEFLQQSYPVGTNVLTNENGPWYIEWFSKLRLNATNFNLELLDNIGNHTELVIDTIHLREVEVIVIFSRLDYPLSDVYKTLELRGVIRFVRSYTELRGYGSLIYEVV